jgi:hypothetical protein
MLTPDEKLAEDFLEALDLRSLPQVPQYVSEAGRDERWWLEQQYEMIDAVVGWLERWETNPRTGSLRARHDPLCEAVAVVHDHLAFSKDRLRERMADLDEAADWALRDLCEPARWDRLVTSNLSPVTVRPAHATSAKARHNTRR